MRLPPELACRPHGEPFALAGHEPPDKSSVVRCVRGCTIPVVGRIPRFVESSGYASGFGLQWNRFRKTQLDSHTGATISRNRLSRCLGGSLDVVRGRSVLEVGCGAGRFTEILLEAGARVFACDLSDAVDANYENCGGSPGYFICQADIHELPVRPGSFDVVLCLGVVQHTPEPEATIRVLAEYVRPRGLLVLDHYSDEYDYTRSRRIVRESLLMLPPALAARLAVGLARILLPVHRLARNGSPLRGRVQGTLRAISPLVDYFDSYPELGDEILGQWAILDTLDMLTDRFKHFRSPAEVERALAACGLVELEVARGGNGVEARAWRPAADGA